MSNPWIIPVYCFLLTMALMGYSSPSLADEPPTIPYRWEFFQPLDPQIDEMLREVSLTLRTQERPPQGILSLHHRAHQDVERFAQMLRAEGWFANQVTVAVEEADPDHPDDTTVIRFRVEEGPRFLFGDVQLDIDGKPTTSWPTAEKLGLTNETPARSELVRKAEKSLLQAIEEQGYPFAKLLPRQAIVDHGSHRMILSLKATTGPLVRLGKAVFHRGESLSQDLLRTLLTWQVGDIYRPELLKKTQSQLIATGVFSRAELVVEPQPDDSGNHPVQVQLTPRKPRTVSMGAGFSTDLGFRLNLEWLHRNTFGGGERTAPHVEISQAGQLFKTTFSKPKLWATPFSLLTESLYQRELKDAYQATTLNLHAGLERRFQKTWKVRMGVGYNWSNISDPTVAKNEEFGLINFPLSADRDTTDSPLDPTRGYRLNVTSTPFLETLENGVFFVKFQGEYSQYILMAEEPRLILASRLGLGTLQGGHTYSIPKNLRFYAGGSGSVRGFADQFASPLDSSHTPMGGRSLAYLTTEVRYRPLEDVEGVLFTDVGGAYDNSLPDFSQDSFASYGGGIRYTTPIGPLRFDLAFPVNPRVNVDDAFQFYLSLGQAF